MTLRAKCIVMLTATMVSLPSLMAQWTPQPFPSDEYLWKVRFADENNGWVLGLDFIWKTDDGGNTWEPQDSSLGGGYALHAVDASTAFYANWSGTRGIRRTTDGGTSWETTDSEPAYYTDFEFITSVVGYVAGGTPLENNSILRKTTDGGNSWTTVSVIEQDDLYGEFEGISFVSEAIGWGITYMGTIYHTVDGGVTWVVQDSAGAVESMRDIQFVSPDSGWAVGGIAGEMKIWRTSDGGETWVKEVYNGNSVREIQMLDPRTGWRVGMLNSGPWIARTTDGGMTWEGQDVAPEETGFESISMVNENLGWAVSWRLYRTMNGGISGVAEEAPGPGEFLLKQNYPNPFNPMTTFSFSIRSSVVATLTIVDLLGREVATVVKEKLAPGSYERQWDATGFPSGVYFYRLQAGDFMETRKLVLVR